MKAKKNTDIRDLILLNVVFAGLFYLQWNDPKFYYIYLFLFGFEAVLLLAIGLLWVCCFDGGDPII